MIVWKKYRLLHGGFGLFTQNDIPKSVCLAMELLSGMGDTLLAQGEGYLVSEKREEIQIFLYHYCHYNLLYRYRHMVNISKTNREEVFVHRNPKAFYIRLQNLPEKDYTICRYGITKQGQNEKEIRLRKHLWICIIYTKENVEVLINEQKYTSKRKPLCREDYSR